MNVFCVVVYVRDGGSVGLGWVGECMRELRIWECGCSCDFLDHIYNFEVFVTNSHLYTVSLLRKCRKRKKKRGRQNFELSNKQRTNP